MSDLAAWRHPRRVGSRVKSAVHVGVSALLAGDFVCRALNENPLVKIPRTGERAREGGGNGGKIECRER